MGDNLNLPDRYGVRTPMQWDDSLHGGFTTGVPFTEMVQGDYHYQKVNVADQLKSQHSLLRTIQRMIAIRKNHAALSGDMQWMETSNSAVLAYVRKNAEEAILVLNNLSSRVQVAQIPAEYQKSGQDLCENRAITLSAQITLPPYSYRWIKL